MNTGSCRCFCIMLFALIGNLHLLAARLVEPNNASVTVIRKDNQQPITDAVVKIVQLEEANRSGKEIAGFTGLTGTFNYTFTEPCIIQISHLGFVTLTDTLYKIEKKIYPLVSTVTNIQDVVVTGQYSPNAVQKSVYEVKIISGAELKAKGANNLREALQSKLNIDLGQDAVFGSSLGINGISGEGVKIMVDGIPIVGRLDGKLDLSQINLNNIDHIEIVEGPLSVIYGTDAMGGVINIITKTFQAEKVNLNLKAYYETAGQYNLELNTGFTFKKNQLYLSGGRNFFDGFTTLDSIPRFQEWKTKEQYFSDAKYMVTGNRLRFSLSGSFFRELMLDRSTPKLAHVAEPGDTSWTYQGNDMHYLTYRPRAAASFMYRFKESNQLDVLLGYSGFYRYANKYYKNLVTGVEKLVDDKSQQDTSRYHQVTARATYTLPALKCRLNFLFGVDINQEFIWQNRIAGEKKKLGDYAAFGSTKISVVEGLDIQPAVRFAYNTVYKTPLIPSLNIRYNHNDKFVLRAGYGRGFRSPSAKELYLNFAIDAHYILGNASLKAEDGHNANISFSYFLVKQKHQFTFSASTFFNYIFNKIELVRVADLNLTPTYQYTNYKNYSTYGGQAGISYKWDRLQLSASAQFTGYNVIYKIGANSSLKTWSPDLSATAAYLIPKAEIAIYVGYKFNGVKSMFSVAGTFNSGTRDAYHLMDFSLSRNFWKDRIQLTVGGKNLAGVKNVATEGVTVVGHNANPNSVPIGWGQTFFTSLILHFSK